MTAGRRQFVCTAILFDLDGVLVDSRAVVERQWSRWAQAHGLDAEQVIHVAHGRPTAETVAGLAPHLDVAAEATRIEQAEIADTDGLRAMPGAAELLASIPCHRWAVATSGTRALAVSRLHHLALPFPIHLVTADDTVRGKPHPEPYLKAAELLGVSARECLVLEDSPAGVQAGKLAGARVIALPTTYSYRELSAADLLVERLSDISVEVDSETLKLNARPCILNT